MLIWSVLEDHAITRLSCSLVIIFNSPLLCPRLRAIFPTYSDGASVGDIRWFMANVEKLQKNCRSLASKAKVSPSMFVIIMMSLLIALTCTCGGIYPGRVESASPVSDGCTPGSTVMRKLTRDFHPACRSLASKATLTPECLTACVCGHHNALIDCSYLYLWRHLPGVGWDGITSLEMDALQVRW